MNIEDAVHGVPVVVCGALVDLAGEDVQNRNLTVVQLCKCGCGLVTVEDEDGGRYNFYLGDLTLKGEADMRPHRRWPRRTVKRVNLP